MRYCQLEPAFMARPPLLQPPLSPMSRKARRACCGGRWPNVRGAAEHLPYDHERPAGPPRGNHKWILFIPGAKAPGSYDNRPKCADYKFSFHSNSYRQRRASDYRSQANFPEFLVETFHCAATISVSSHVHCGQPQDYPIPFGVPRKSCFQVRTRTAMHLSW
jgi:hypothetical protein